MTINFQPDVTALETKVIRQLSAAGMTLATAESCTGGLVSTRLTNVSGATQVFVGGVVAYHNRVKMNLLKVKYDTLVAHGAVSEETAEEMAMGAKALLETEYAVSLTGIAGPHGGTAEKPVGLVYIGVAGPNGVRVTRNNFAGGRHEVKMASSDKALTMILEELAE